MRIIQNYKIYSKNYLPIFSVPKIKILKFHRPKWNFVQKALLKKKLFNSKKLFFKSHALQSCKTSRWQRYSTIFKDRLNLKKSIQLLFGNSITNQYIKKLFKKLKKNNTFYNIVQTALFKTEYKLDILLWRLNFYKHSFLAKNAVYNKQIYVNNKRQLFCSFLQIGDIITIPKVNLLSFSSKKFNLVLLHSFIEVDYYTNSFIVVKALKNLTKKDFLLLVRNTYNVLNLKDYAKK